VDGLDHRANLARYVQLTALAERGSAIETALCATLFHDREPFNSPPCEAGADRFEASMLPRMDDLRVDLREPSGSAKVSHAISR
jgi:hypothetical protein